MTDEPGRLSRREREILRLIVLGLSNREIGRLLMLSENTVKIHVSPYLRENSLYGSHAGSGSGDPDGTGVVTAYRIPGRFCAPIALLTFAFAAVAVSRCGGASHANCRSVRAIR